MSQIPRPQTESLDVQSFLDSHRFSAYQWLILILCFLIVAIDGFDTAAMGYIAPALVQEWGIEKSSLGPVMSAALFGLAFGAIFAGPMADRVGRKRVLVLSVFFFGACSLATAFAPSVTWLTVLRFLTGVGLGAAMPNAVTLMSEYAPARRRAILVNTMFCGFPLGSAGGGFFAAAIIPHFGWHSVLIFGGIVPLVLAVVLVAALPESIRYMVVRQYPADQIRKVLARVTGAVLDTTQAFTVNETAPAARSAVGTVLAPRYRVGSAMLWLTYFMGLVIFYLLTSWMPTLMKDAGFTLQRASLLTALFPLGGGIGTIAAGWFMDRFNPNKVIAITYALTGVLIYAVGHGAGGDPFVLGLLIFLAGTAMNGAQSSMPTLAASFYPTQGRATGVAWMLGIGRFGGIAGALLGAELLRMHLGFDAIFTLLTVPAFIAAGALVVKQFSGAGDAVDSGEPSPKTVAGH
ncbi:MULTISPECIES: aromatic acid/H+ symport family MFS transporter [unclassified Cupriavidus]|uniref:MFS transporter n=1 Tax=unclassified Cupriavidus TaxID=2640874 RepID=UPI001BFFED7F|nr:MULTISPECIES: aromatic acid/H+ symport family MFS transporter [unclassified Cupriavidus]MCA3182729.1 aromatic acid/H+ symport family MFS transporter [Cupriavidus sp.]MCA3188873.1 aromatic acid/H+ symport family MFS transporter [Cupriavidus sp.]MCA3198593.1 aromatic acid/H+ symport family MFS transporter [Cupriavidus sp.]MCA3201339.1 aromatic acid/H+ symport family MFS transporter [Cupriavidus sp.]MCA3209819.1 aromatic acid/H+ symport family MFS transporter [Cupriavidus sp.]